jgi:hypothetical protein
MRTEASSRRASADTLSSKYGIQMMSKRVIAPLVLGTVFLLNSSGWGRDWKPYQATKNGDIYYLDPESIEKLPDAIVRVWVKTERTEFGGGDFKKHVQEVTSGKKEKVTGEILQLIDIHCSWKTFRVVNLAVFDKNKELNEYYSDPSEWSVIPSGSVTEFLCEEVCK